jgi:hypothetical protein
MELNHCTTTLGPTQEGLEGGPQWSDIWFNGDAWRQSAQTTSRWTKTLELGSLVARAWHRHEEHEGEAHRK